MYHKKAQSKEPTKDEILKAFPDFGNESRVGRKFWPGHSGKKANGIKQTKERKLPLLADAMTV